MINFILRAKHWQIFLVMFAPAMMLQIYTIITLITNLTSHALPLQEVMVEYAHYIIIAGLFATCGSVLWMWSVGVGLQRHLPDGLTLPTGIFKLSLLFPVCYMASALGFVHHIITDGTPNFLVFILIFPLHILSMGCQFYSIYVVARTLKTVELQKKVMPGEYILEFFLVWFALVGIWILQPKINKIVEQSQLPGSA